MSEDLATRIALVEAQIVTLQARVTLREEDHQLLEARAGWLESRTGMLEEMVKEMRGMVAQLGDDVSRTLRTVREATDALRAETSLAVKVMSELSTRVTARVAEEKKEKEG